MKKMKNICIIVGIIILISCGVILAKDVYYTIEIKSEIDLSDEEKKVINEKELVSDIKAYIYGKSFKYARIPNYPSGVTIPIYDGICYGNGYTANGLNGEFYSRGGKSRFLYEAERNPNIIIYLKISAMLIIEVICISIYFFKKIKSWSNSTK